MTILNDENLIQSRLRIFCVILIRFDIDIKEVKVKEGKALILQLG